MGCRRLYKNTLYYTRREIALRQLSIKDALSFLASHPHPPTQYVCSAVPISSLHFLCSLAPFIFPILLPARTVYITCLKSTLHATLANSHRLIAISSAKHSNTLKCIQRPTCVISGVKSHSPDSLLHFPPLTHPKKGCVPMLPPNIHVNPVDVISQADS